MNSMQISRRDVLKGAAGAAVLAGAGQAAYALASESQDKDKAATATEVPSWLGQAPAVADSDCVETVDVDVLVCGAGCAGYFAAEFAAQEGAKTLLIEKCVVGCGIRDSALGAVDSRMQKEQGVSIDKNEIVNDFFGYSHGNANMALQRLWADNSGEAVDWYCDLVSADETLHVDLESSMPEESTRYHMWPTGHGTNDGSDLVGGVQTGAVTKVMKLLDERLTENGGEVRYETALVELIKDGDRVVGAYATNPDGDYIRINAAKGVIVATGGYVNNDEMYTALQGDLKKAVSGWCCHATKPATGDGIKACLWAGASFDPVKTSMIFDRGLVAPDVEIAGPESGGYYFTLSSQPWLKVNNHGQRICNESTPYDYVIHSAERQDDHAWYCIFDANWAENVKRFHTIGCSTIDLHEGGDQQAMGLDAQAAEIDDLVEQGLLAKADTIRELGEKLGFDDLDAFEATVARQNENFDNQEDPDFGKEPFRLSDLRTAPFYGAKMGGLALCTLDGIRINEKFQALDENNRPIEGLYALGNDSGCYYGGTYTNFAAGTNAGRCITHGMLCGRAVAQL